MRIYISHASEDHEAARALFQQLKSDGFDPWLDEYSFGAGEWEPQIEPAIRGSDVFVFLISGASTGRPGLYDDEIKFALKLDREDRMRSPKIIPLRLDDSKRPAKLAPYLSFDLFELGGYDEFKQRISTLARKTSRFVFSLHGIKTRGVWQKEVTPLLAKAGFIPDPGDFGNFGARKLLWESSRQKQVERFRDDYMRECDRLGCGVPSIVAHSFGTYIAAHAMRKYPQIKFDRMILCGAILTPEFPWDKLANNGQVKAVLNQYGGQDFWAGIVAWFVADAGQSGRYGFSVPAACLTQQNYPRFRHSDYFYDLNYTRNWLPFLNDQALGPPAIEEKERPNWRFRTTLIAVVAIIATVAMYFLRSCIPFPANRNAGALNWHIVEASATPRPSYLQPLDRVLDDIDTPLPPGQEMDIDRLQAGAQLPVKWLLLLSSSFQADKLPDRIAVPPGVSAEVTVYVLDAGDGAGRILTRSAGFGPSIEVVKPAGSGLVYIAAFVFPLDRSAYDAIQANPSLQVTK